VAPPVFLDPDPGALSDLLAALGVKAAVEQSMSAGVRLGLDTPSGAHNLTAAWRAGRLGPASLGD
jgi:tetrahydromethanopterin S-methyltransferase subunit H